MKVAVFAYSRKGCETARRVLEAYPQEECRSFTMARFEEEGFEPIGKPSKDFFAPLFVWADAMIFVGAVGIAVREIAPHVKDKRSDPAVLSLDELGQFVIPLLSGHIGGANELTQKLARHLGSTPVITTATDINHKFSVDAWATRQGVIIGNMHAAKMVSAEILEKNVPLCSDFPIATALPNGVVRGEQGEVGIQISYRKTKPFRQTLSLIPKILHLGIGCRRGTSAETIAEAVDLVLKENELDVRAIKCAASIDLKQNEEGLLRFCQERAWDIRFYSAEELKAVEGDFTPSEFVKSVTGVDNVCERAALHDAKTLIVKKTASNGVTVAVAAESLEVRFE